MSQDTAESLNRELLLASLQDSRLKHPVMTLNRPRIRRKIPAVRGAVRTHTLAPGQGSTHTWNPPNGDRQFAAVSRRHRAHRSPYNTIQYNTDYKLQQHLSLYHTPYTKHGHVKHVRSTPPPMTILRSQGRARRSKHMP